MYRLVMALFLAACVPASSTSPAWEVGRDADNGALVYTNPQGGIVVVPFTPSPSETALPTLTPSVTPSLSETALPTLTPSVTPPSASLVNGDMEAGLEGWQLYTLRGGLEVNVERVSGGASPYAVHAGDASIRVVGRWSCWIGGLYQVVPAIPGRRYTLTAYSMVWANQSSNFNLPHDTNVYTKLAVGIDPEGDTDPSISGIRWATRDGTDAYERLSVSATAASPTITVYLQANLGVTPGDGCQWPLAFMLAFFDSASLAP